MSGPIDTYVSDLAKSLPGPRQVRRDLLAELTDGLRDAADIHHASGLPARDAELLAVRESGPIGELVADYRTELAAKSGQHTAMQLMVMLLATNVSWDLIWFVVPSGGAPMPGVGVLARVITCSTVLCAVICGLGLAMLRLPGRVPGRTPVPVRRVNTLIVTAGATAIAVIVASALAMNLVSVGDAGRMMDDSAALGVLTAASVLTMFVLLSALWRTARTTHTLDR
ncbi:permease prefix domain 1-containing protein [Flindersiella endophytica]